jgi:hypothetical protein
MLRFFLLKIAIVFAINFAAGKDQEFQPESADVSSAKRHRPGKSTALITRLCRSRCLTPKFPSRVEEFSHIFTRFQILN